jgi:fructose-1,6-bisphosphatase
MTNIDAQPDSRYIIETLIDENKALNDNRLYLMSLLKQVAAEFNEAKELWELERESLKKSVNDEE